MREGHFYTKKAASGEPGTNSLSSESLSHVLTFLLSSIYLEGLPSLIHPFVVLRLSLSLLSLSPQLPFSLCFSYRLHPNTSPALWSSSHP